MRNKKRTWGESNVLAFPFATGANLLSGSERVNSGEHVSRRDAVAVRAIHPMEGWQAVILNISR